jgi:hypothetical protein
MMSFARPAAPVQPLPSARLLDLADPPIACADIELSAPTHPDYVRPRPGGAAAYHRVAV